MRLNRSHIGRRIVLSKLMMPAITKEDGNCRGGELDIARAEILRIVELCDIIQPAIAASVGAIGGIAIDGGNETVGRRVLSVTIDKSLGKSSCFQVSTKGGSTERSEIDPTNDNR